ncbi:hypothetical protein [Kurthia zopfii]|uniref:hypothetical protein n=1 Tax=Kurthia zopfii TaxID=1650 RepID=UPI000F6D1ED9|nr:hypothetical protein [Kurthia zopfii]VEI07845.1 Uncharacterised protein [Kurthia zopfii]
MKRKIIYIITLLVQAIITFGVSIYFDVRFIEVMFFVGLFFIVIGLFFLSGDNTLTNYNNAQLQARTGISLAYEKTIYTVGPFLISSIVYSVVGLGCFLLIVYGWL